MANERLNYVPMEVARQGAQLLRGMFPTTFQSARIIGHTDNAKRFYNVLVEEGFYWCSAEPHYDVVFGGMIKTAPAVGLLRRTLENYLAPHGLVCLLMPVYFGADSEFQRFETLRPLLIARVIGRLFTRKSSEEERSAFYA